MATLINDAPSNGVETTVLDTNEAYWESRSIPLPAGLADKIIQADRARVSNEVQAAHKSAAAAQDDALKALQLSVPLLRRLLGAGKLEDAMTEGAEMISLICFLLHNARLA